MAVVNRPFHLLTWPLDVRDLSETCHFQTARIKIPATSPMAAKSSSHRLLRIAAMMHATAPTSIRTKTADSAMSGMITVENRP